MVNLKKSAIIIFLFCVTAFLHSGAITLQDAVLKNSRPAGLPEMINSASGDTYYQQQDNSKINLVSYRTGEVVKTVFDAATSRNCPFEKFDGYIVSPDESKILLYTDSDPIYRHSFRAKYYVYEIMRNNMKPLSKTDKQEIATFSPDGRMVAFVVDNNVYIKKLDYDTEIAVTTDGAKDKVINGVPDWVYQEEFGQLNSLCFNAESTVLCFMKWDESQVRSFDFPVYEGFCNRKSDYSVYPGTFRYKYPTAGEKNSTVKVVSYDVDTRKSKNLEIPLDEDGYIPDIRFAGTTNRLMVMTLNRNQNHLQIFSVNPLSTVSKKVYEENTQSWISIEKVIGNIRYSDDSFLVWSDKSGNGHIYKYSISGNLISQITKGNFIVTKYYGYNPVLKSHYFQSTQEGAVNRTVNKLDSKGVLTKISKKTGTNDAVFSTDMNYFILHHSDANTPDTYAMWNVKGKKLRDLELNEEYAAKYCAIGIPKKQFIEIPAGENKLNAFVIFPADFDSSRRYPVILSQYSGPSSQTAVNEWKFTWEHYAAMQGYIVVCADGRGTFGRGKDWESAVYMKLGILETEDQVAVAEYMAQQPYVDASKIGIFGWSYGGYETLMAMTHDKDVFAAGVSVAPVTDWRFYDTIYGERFMRTPQQNPLGYANASVLRRVSNLNGRLLIMSGTADDNVHLTNTLSFISELTAANKFCEMMLYPNMDHSINTCDTRYILYAKVLDFFDRYLK